MFQSDALNCETVAPPDPFAGIPARTRRTLFVLALFSSAALTS